MKIAINICRMQICRSAIKSNHNKYWDSYRKYHFVSIDIHRHPVIKLAPSRPDAADFSPFVLPLHLSSAFRMKMNSLKERLTRVPYCVSSPFMTHCKNCALMVRKCDKGIQWVESLEREECVCKLDAGTRKWNTICIGNDLNATVWWCSQTVGCYKY